ncbi:hypothetical protein JIQ42_01634 [Leishmania sp. Namibia]|uniref:hypothetical protein n=1 Tax=Leishmania sp. Namibia TaxID=2802991 RepID=UPI001B6AA457|nr:hypothetical protein JIQ42_01634 [Leishmania sp. Namibia]
MSQSTRAEFSLLRYSAGDALHFVVENGSRRHVKDEGASSLPGLSMVVELQERHAVRDRMHKCGTIDDPLYLEDLTHICTHEQWCAHSQTACALAKNAIEQSLQHRSELRVLRYGAAVMRLAEGFPSLLDSEEKAPSTAADSPSVATSLSPSSYVSSPLSAQDDPRFSVMTKKSPGSEASLATEDDVSDGPQEEEEELESYLLQHPSLTADMAAARLRRRYLRCCNVIGVCPSASVRRRLLRCVRSNPSNTLGSRFAAKRTECPLSPASETTATLHPTATGRSWMAFPGMIRLLREKGTVPYEVIGDFSGCAEIGQHRRQFIALLGVLEECRNTVVFLNLATTRITDEEVRVLCLFCRAYLRRLQVLDLSGNKNITDKVAPRLKQLAASLPLLQRLSVRGTSLSRANARTLRGILCRKPL